MNFARIYLGLTFWNIIFFKISIGFCSESTFSRQDIFLFISSVGIMNLSYCILMYCKLISLNILLFIAYNWFRVNGRGHPIGPFLLNAKNKPSLFRVKVFIYIFAHVFTHILSKRQKSIAFYKYSNSRLNGITRLFHTLIND